MVTLRPVLAVLLVVAVLLTVLWLVQRRFVYFPDRTRVPSAATVFDGGRDVTLETSDGLRLGAWLVPPTGPSRQFAVLVANGNGGNRYDRTPLATALAAKGFTVLLFDYRGYGGNPGNPTERGLARDVRAAYRYLVDIVSLPPERIIFFGESLGSAVVTELAIGHPPAGLLLRSPFVDLAGVARVHYPILPTGALLRDRYPLAENLTRVTVPTAVVYGTADSVVPPQQSRDVADRAAGPVSVTAVEGADHNDRALLDGPELVEAVVRLAGNGAGR